MDREGHLKLADFGLSKKGIELYQEPFTGHLPVIRSTVMGPGTVEKKREKYLQQRKHVSQKKTF